MYILRVEERHFVKKKNLEEMGGEGDKDALQKVASWKWGH